MADVALTYLAFWLMIYLGCGILGVNPPERTHARPTRNMLPLVSMNGPRVPQVGIGIGNDNGPVAGPGSGFAVDGTFGGEIHHHHYIHGSSGDSNMNGNGAQLPVYGQQISPVPQHGNGSGWDRNNMNINRSAGPSPNSPPGGAAIAAEAQPLVASAAIYGQPSNNPHVHGHSSGNNNSTNIGTSSFNHRGEGGVPVGVSPRASSTIAGSWR
jgi:hypothetical protein